MSINTYEENKSLMRKMSEMVDYEIKTMAAKKVERKKVIVLGRSIQHNDRRVSKKKMQSL